MSSKMLGSRIDREWWVLPQVIMRSLFAICKSGGYNVNGGVRLRVANWRRGASLAEQGLAGCGKNWVRSDVIPSWCYGFGTRCVISLIEGKITHGVNSVCTKYRHHHLMEITASSDVSMVDLNEAHGGATAGRPRRILSSIRGCAFLASRSMR